MRLVVGNAVTMEIISGEVKVHICDTVAGFDGEKWICQDTLEHPRIDSAMRCFWALYFREDGAERTTPPMPSPLPRDAPDADESFLCYYLEKAGMPCEFTAETGDKVDFDHAVVLTIHGKDGEAKIRIVEIEGDPARYADYVIPAASLTH